MAEQVEVKILTVDAVTNLAELKEAISQAKKDLQGMTLGSQEYQDKLKEVIEGQNLMRAALNGTTASMDELRGAVDSEGKSYNALVNRMADLKREFRATSDEAKRAALAQDIKSINDELKRLDAMKGDFQRNVGDYLAHDLKDIVKDLPSGLTAIKKPLDDVTKSMGLMSKQPILGIIGLLAPLIQKVVEGIKESDDALAGVKKMMDALKPVLDFFTGILQDVVDYVGDIISEAADFLSSNGIFQKVIQGVMGVGNAILQFVIAPFKGIAAAVKVFREEGVKGLGDAAKAFGAEMKAGVAFKSNYEAGQAFADGIAKGARSRKKEVAKAGKELVDEAAKEMERRVKEWVEHVKERTAAENYLKSLMGATAEDAQDALDDWNAQLEAETDALVLALENETKAEQWYRDEQVRIAKEAAEQKLSLMQSYASSMSGLLNNVADLMEAEGKSAKNLRIAAATIDMIQGAVTAYSTAQSLGPIAGPIVGAANAAAVVAAGLANIAKIRATQVSKSSAPSTTATTAASVSAPSVQTVNPTTVTTGARTETALNSAAQPQRVYILQSDIEAAGSTSRVQVAESSF